MQLADSIFARYFAKALMPLAAGLGFSGLVCTLVSDWAVRMKDMFTAL